MKNVKNLNKNKTFIVEDPNKGEPVIQCMDLYKAKIHFDGSLEKL